MAEIQKTSEEIANYFETKSAFVDYTRFEGDDDQRAEQRRAFIGGYEYAPSYDYAKLDFFIDEEKITEKKTLVQEAIFELEAAKKNPDHDPALLEMYIRFHEARLKKIMLVEAARDMMKPYDSAGADTARETFMHMNREVYGEVDAEVYMGMLSAESKRVAEFEPNNRAARMIKNDLQEVFSRLSLESQPEEEMLNEQELAALRSGLYERYANVLAAIPLTDDDTYYDAAECATIMNDALVASGLAESGWQASINPGKQNPSTGAKKVNLPTSTRRNASELRRLTLHEEEAHARRAQNGTDSGIKLLSGGTADYADVEEGLGVLFEIGLEGTFDNPSFHRARDRYITAGLALGLDSTPRDSRETFEVLWRMIAVRSAKEGNIYEETIQKSKELAYTHIENAFRGTPFHQKGVIYTKLKVYYEGLVKNARYFKDALANGTFDEALDIAMVGKINHTDPEEVRLVQEVLAHRISNTQEV